MRRRPLTLAALVLLLAALTLAVYALARPRQTAIRATLSLGEAMGTGNTAGYSRALAPRPFDFPADHGPHPDFRTEWWYFTGNLSAADGRRFGYQLTFFRSAIAPSMPERTSEWATRQVYMAHFAVTDAESGEFHAFDAFSRAAAGLAGARARLFRVWLDDWSASSIAPAGATFPIRLRASRDSIAIDLRLLRGKPPVPQGDRGLSRKGPEPGNASYYYSLTRMPTAGVVHIGGATYAVEGASWLDREWSTSALGEDVDGWDWFALQLSDSTELMYYKLRRRDGTADPFSAGTLVDAAGATTPLAAHDVAIGALDTWRSPHDGTRYPSGWRLRVPSAALDLTVRPLLEDQELNLAVRYWEGAVIVRGTRAGKAVSGCGYVELTGYGARPRAPFVTR